MSTKIIEKSILFLPLPCRKQKKQEAGASILRNEKFVNRFYSVFHIFFEVFSFFCPFFLHNPLQKDIKKSHPLRCDFSLLFILGRFSPLLLRFLRLQRLPFLLRFLPSFLPFLPFLPLLRRRIRRYSYRPSYQSSCACMRLP